ncbi:hypothetical protein E2C01_022616 [Portunus trituberculatus]|uniref:Uncharacterized protein n=1 Tax=Portunus trituberculatus TaxID=210409 RepID=A0A5B7E7S3_PORTR|nr:hypothetical protein [Portunus trituberculatus]
MSHPYGLSDERTQKLLAEETVDLTTCSSSRCAKVMKRMNSSLPDDTDTIETSTLLNFSRSRFIFSK